MRLLALAVSLLALLNSCTVPERNAEEEPPSLKDGSFFAELNGFRIHYEVHGQGPVLMTLPNSWGVNVALLRELYRPLEESLTLVYFDPRGMGESDAVRRDSDMGMAAVRADFNALRQHLGLGAVAVIGWSNGAVNLIYLASESAEAVSAAIFLHGQASFTEADAQAFATEYPDLMQDFLDLEATFADASLSDAEKTARLRANWLGGFLPRACADQEGATALVSKLFANSPFSWRHVDYANWEGGVFDARPQLQEISARSLIIFGAHDLSPLEKAQEMDAALLDSELVILGRSGHFSPVEEPEAFRDAVFTFLGVE